ncbi:MAG: hypothetical protein ACR2LX_17130 [Jatrophihabitans sp.]
MDSTSVPGRVTDAEFARAFFRRAVTRDRVVAALESLASKELRFGPYSAAGLASVASSGTFDTASVELTDADRPAFAVTVPAILDITVRLGAESKLRADVQIDLALSVRAAAPLLLVIDIAPVRAQDIRISVQGRGLGGALSSVLASLGGELRAQVARQVTAVLDTDGLRRSRTFDIAARIEGTPDESTPETWDWLDDGEFGRRFVRRAVSERRLRKALDGLAGQTVEIGPLKAGPREVATVRVTGEVAVPTVAAGTETFEITIPLKLDLVVGLARDNRFHADVEVPLVAAARPASELHVVLDIAEVTPDSVRVSLTSDGKLAGLLGRVGRLDHQIQEQVADTVNSRVADASGRIVDIGGRIDRARGAGAEDETVHPDHTGRRAGRAMTRPRPTPRPNPRPSPAPKH